MRSHALDSAASRIGALRLLLLLLIAVLAARAGQLSTRNPDAVDQGQKQVHTKITLPGARGLILDRSQRELAISVYAPSVYGLPKLVADPDAAARRIGAILGAQPGPIAARLREHDGFTYIARWIEPAQAERIRALGLAGVGIELEPRRTYPAGPMAAPLIGFADIDGKGVRGIEQAMNEWLAGRPRTLAVQRDAKGRLLSSSTVDPRVAAGGDIALTLDAGLQAQAEAALAEAVAASEAKAGLVIAVDPATGDVLSLVEAPGYDPNAFRRIEFPQTRSRAFLDAVEPGSTMKAFVVAAALDAGVIDMNTTIDTEEGWVRIPGKTIRDHHPYGVIDPAGVLRFSSNVGAVWIAQRLGAERHHEALMRYGFGQSTGSGFPDESHGLIRDWQSWKPVDHATVAFGQGMNVTPIQLAMATAALANDGVLMEPRLVAARRPSMGEWEPTLPRAERRIMLPETARAVVAMMETVVGPEGTGRLAGLADVRVAGKTGTSQVLDLQKGTYSQTRYTAWFAGIAPADDPRVAIVVALEEPMGRVHTGGGVAAPLFARVAAAQLAHHGILTEPEPIAPAAVPSWVAVQEQIEARKRARAEAEAAEQRRMAAQKRPAPAPRRRASEPAQVALAAVSSPPSVASAPPGWEAAAPAHLRAVLVPDFRGESMDDAKRLAAREALDLRVDGASRGRVVEQWPAAGTIVAGTERTVRLRFSLAQEG